jgi:tRNA dimethylallyltransferase
MGRGEQYGTEILHKELSEKDSIAASKIHPNDLQRIVRALAVYYQTGIPLSAHQVQKNKPADLDFVIVKLIAERDILYPRINKRVDEMIKSGLYEEFQKLVADGYHEKSPGMQCVGYKEFFPLLNNECSLNDSIELIQRNTRRYAKRQITWFSHQVKGWQISPEISPAAVREYYRKNLGFLV